MKILHKLTSLLLALLCAGVLILPVAATTTKSEHDGVEVSIAMDKEVYEDGEPITATITVKNTKLEIVTIENLEQLIPEGYRLSETSEGSLKDIELAYGETAVLQVTFEKDTSEEGAEESEDFFDKLLTGETWGIPNLLIIMVLGIAVAVFMFLT